MKDFSIQLGTLDDREQIYRIRYEIYALELGQHERNDAGYLTDLLDQYNEYLVCKDGDIIAGFVSLTPPGHSFSLDKYRSRDSLPFLYQNSYEVRILTVQSQYRGNHYADQLLLAAADYVIERNGALIVAIGRSDLMPYYKRCGFIAVDESYLSGEVTFQLMFTTPHTLKAKIEAHLSGQ